jgi:3-deoxy-D-manno-octulosonic-acid transferase
VAWSAVLYLLGPFFVAHLFWRGLRYRAYWHGWSERFGYGQSLRGKHVIWVHAVSVGEVRSAAELVNQLLTLFPQHCLLVTTMTPTGAEQARDLFGDKVIHSYVPYDFPGAVRRFIDRVQPEFAIIAETEFWPNLFQACSSNRIPLMLVNVRLSQSSLKGYLWIPRTVRRMLANADLVCPQTRADAHRLKTLGVPDELIHVTGNLKFDTPVPATLVERGRELRRAWGQDRPVVIAGSTHQGEERRLLSAFAQLRHRHDRLLLVIVPRQPERFGSVARLCRRSGYKVARRSSSGASLGADVDILVGDTMGELQMLYSAADVAFVGGSLARRGGHNILEACAVGRPVLFGPHMFHFEEIGTMALDQGAGRQVRDTAELTAVLDRYLSDPAERRAAGDAAMQLVAVNRGALARTLELIRATLAVSNETAAVKIESVSGQVGV